MLVVSRIRLLNCYRHSLQIICTKYVPVPACETANLTGRQLIRDGNHSVADLMSLGKTMLGRRHVLPSVVGSLSEMMVEGTFTTGTYLVTVHNPISTDDGNLDRALYGSFLPIPSQDKFPLADPSEYEPHKQPGAVVTVKNSRITLNEGRQRIKLRVVSKGDRPIQVGMYMQPLLTF